MSISSDFLFTLFECNRLRWIGIILAAWRSLHGQTSEWVCSRQMHPCRHLADLTSTLCGTSHRPLFSIQLCPVLPTPSSSSCIWNLLSTYSLLRMFSCLLQASRVRYQGQGQGQGSVTDRSESRVWNCLPAALRAVEDNEQFKKLLKHICSIRLRRLVTFFVFRYRV